MNRLNGVRNNLMNVSVVWMVAAAMAAGVTMGVGGGTPAAAAQPVPALLTTVPIPGPGPILAPTPARGPVVVLVAYGGYELGRYVWTKYDGPKAVKKAYDATRQAAGSVVRFSRSAVKTVSRTTLQATQAVWSRAAAAYRWLRE